MGRICVGISRFMMEDDIVLETNLGSIKIELYWNHAPKSCHNFKELCARSIYNGCLFHTVSKNYIAQSGDPANTAEEVNRFMGATLKMRFIQISNSLVLGYWPWPV